jgi:hypothetical protein
LAKSWNPHSWFIVYTLGSPPVPAFTLYYYFRFDFASRKMETVSCHVIRGKSREAWVIHKLVWEVTSCRYRSKVKRSLQVGRTGLPRRLRTRKENRKNLRISEVRCCGTPTLWFRTHRLFPYFELEMGYIMKKLQLLALADGRKTTEFWVLLLLLSRRMDRLAPRNWFQNTLENDSLYYDAAGI